MMYEVQVKVRAASMNAFGGWLTLHACATEDGARRAARAFDRASLLNRVEDVRVLTPAGAVLPA